MVEPVQAEETSGPEEQGRQRFILDDTGFDEVPKKYRKFYRKWKGAEDSLAPNEVICPVCKVVIRSTRELEVPFWEPIHTGQTPAAAFAITLASACCSTVQHNSITRSVRCAVNTPSASPRTFASS